MKLAIIISTLDGGGAAAIVSQITSNLTKEYDIDIIVNSKRNIRYPYKGRIVDLGINRIPSDTSNIFFQIRVFVKRIVEISRLKKSNRYDVCISYMDSANVVNILTRHSYKKCRTILNVVHNMSALAKSNRKYKYIVSPLIKTLYNKADAIIAQTHDIKRDLAGFGVSERQIFVNYSAVDIKRIDETISDRFKQNDEFALRWIDKDKTVITAGRFTVQKGHWHLIRAFRKVVDCIPDAKLVIFGNGGLKDYYLDLIRSYQLEDNVSLHDFDPDYVWYISHSAVFCFPSLHEGLGMALQDAMACNVACIAADYESGARELLTSGYDGQIEDIYNGDSGIITRTLNCCLYDTNIALDKAEECLAKAIVDLLQDKELRRELAIKARKKAESYDLKVIVDNWERIINEVYGSEK